MLHWTDINSAKLKHPFFKILYFKDNIIKSMLLESASTIFFMLIQWTINNFCNRFCSMKMRWTETSAGNPRYWPALFTHYSCLSDLFCLCLSWFFLCSHKYLHIIRNFLEKQQLKRGGCFFFCWVYVCVCVRVESVSVRLFRGSCVRIIASLRFSSVPILKLHKMCERPGKDTVLPLKTRSTSSKPKYGMSVQMCCSGCSGSGVSSGNVFIQVSQQVCERVLWNGPVLKCSLRNLSSDSHWGLMDGGSFMSFSSRMNASDGTLTIAQIWSAIRRISTITPEGKRRNNQFQWFSILIIFTSKYF